jgi:hypothetical protein
MKKLQSGHELSGGRTDRQTDGRADGAIILCLPSGYLYVSITSLMSLR